MKKLLFGLGLIVILAGCSNSPAPNLYSSLAPGSTVPPVTQTIATSSTTVVAVPDLCQLLTESRAAKFMGSVDSITAFVNSFDTNDPPAYSDCGWTGSASGIQVASAEAKCVRSDDSSVYQEQKQAITGTPGYTVVPVTGLGSSSYLATRTVATDALGPGSGEAEVQFLEGTVYCQFEASARDGNGDAEGTLLVALAKQIDQLLHV